MGVADLKVDHVAVLRRFSRTFTRDLGVLEEHFLGRDRPLGAARVLWELGAAGGDVADLRQRLDLDSGYLSRLLRRLEADGLIVVEPSPVDGRRRRAVLTDLGTLEWLELDHRSDLAAAGLAEHLPASAAARLVRLLDEADRLLRLSSLRFEEVDRGDPRAIAALASYMSELGRRFPGGFDAAAANRADADRLADRGAHLVLGLVGADVVACGALHHLDDTAVEVKRMWVDGGWRGLGLGGRLLDHLEKLAADAGAGVVRLDTNRVLTEAIAMYRARGYVEIARYNDNPDAHHWFERRIGPPDP